MADLNEPTAATGEPNTIIGVLLALPREEFAALHASVERQLAQARAEVARLEFELTQIAEARKVMVAE